jgi:signal transduction histidine kinase
MQVRTPLRQLQGLGKELCPSLVVLKGILYVLLLPARCLQVLEHAVCDCEDRCKQLTADALTAQQQERETRCELAAAREQQAAAQRALQQQTQRLLAAERMRLADLRVSI